MWRAAGDRVHGERNATTSVGSFGVERSERMEPSSMPGKHKEDCMKKLVAVAAVGVALAAIGVTVGSEQALAQAPCYKGESLGKCPTGTTIRTTTARRPLLTRRGTALRSRLAASQR